MTGHTFFFDWEITLIEWIQAHLGSFGETLAVIFSMLGEELALVGIAGILYWCIDKTWGKRVITTLLLGCTCFPLIKNIFLRRRPYFDHPSVRCLRAVHPEGDLYDPVVQGFSFPSGHATNAVGCYLSTTLYTRKKWLIGIGCGLALGIGISRVAVGVHYPTDVLAGWLLGALVVLAVTWAEKYITREWVRGLMYLAVGFPGLFYCKSEDYFTSFGMLIGFVVAVWFEKRFVRFENTRNILRMILRVGCGIGLFLALNELLKLPFPASFLDGGSYGAHIVRLLRYAIDVFVVMGVYPMVFVLTARIGKRKQSGNQVHK